MRDTDYAFGVAKIRYHELSLLALQEIEQLIFADSVSAVVRLLQDKGWDAPEDGINVAGMLEAEADKAWCLLEEAAPDIGVLDALVLQNDFHNLKTVLKCLVSDSQPDEFFIAPSVADPKEINSLVKEKRFGDLPEFLVNAARDGYEAATIGHGSGRLVDIAVDRHCMEQRIIMAHKSKVKLLEDIARLSCAAADIKIALRSTATGKDAEFMKRSMADSGIISSERLIEAALKGQDEIVAYLAMTQLSSAAEAIKSGSVAFEKWCDDIVIEKSKDAKASAFGAEPLAAYYLAKITEIKNVRIIISAKHNLLPDEVIKERMRKAYA